MFNKSLCKRPGGIKLQVSIKAISRRVMKELKLDINKLPLFVTILTIITD